MQFNKLEINKPFKKPSKMGKVWALHVGSFQADLMDMSLYSKFNKGFGYGLVIIDIFSRYGWCYPIKAKGDSYLGLQKWFETYGINREKFFSDDGKEFAGKFSKILSEKGVKQVKINSKITHQVMVERFIRTLKEKIRNYWYANDTYNWISGIEDILYDYNHSIHRMTGMKPIDLLEGENTHEILDFNDELEDILPPGTFVRYLKDKNIGDKPSLSSVWSEKRHKIVSFFGNKYLLDNGLEYPRWKLLVSTQKDTGKLEKKKMLLKDARRDVRFIRKKLDLKNRKQAENIRKIQKKLDVEVSLNKTEKRIKKKKILADFL